MKKALIAAALVLSTGILSANAIMNRDTATTVTESKDNAPVVVTTDLDNTQKATKKDIGTAD